MAIVATLSPTEASVEPGQSATFELTLSNRGQSPETIRLAVRGPAAPYSWVAPNTVTVPPSGQVQARAGFHLPRTSVPAAGPLPFEVELASASGEVNGSGTAGVVQVQAFSAVSLTVDPPEISGRGSAQAQLNIANRGNAPVRVSLEGTGEGLDVRADPTAVTASPLQVASSRLTVTARKKRFTGAERALPFKIVAAPELGAPSEVSGRFVQQTRVAVRTLVTSGVGAGFLVLALVVWATVIPRGSSSSAPSQAPPPTTPADACPAAGHTDNFGVSGLKPADIPQLPNTYSFFHVKQDGCTPIRFNPCQPVHYVQNAALAPPTGAADVREAFRRLSEATGIEFVDDGLTDETARRRPYLPERYGNRWAPILVSWVSFGDQSRDPAIQVVGRGIGQQVDEVLVSGTLSLNIDAVTDSEARTPLQGGFGPPIGSGSGAIGARNVTWGRVILHELAHVVGLGHTRDRGAIMYPETVEQTGRPSEYKEPDKEGLRHLGRAAGCLTTPPLPAA